VTVDYLLRRLGIFVLVIFVAVTINFAVPRIRPTNPIEQRLYEMAAQGGVNVGQIQEMIKIYNEKFGFDKPLYVQYYNYWVDLLHGDLGTSITFYPASVREEILRAAPWTIGLLLVSTLLSFGVGSIFGALMAWPKIGKSMTFLVPIFMTLSAIPYYLLGIVLIFVFALVWPVLPTAGAYASGTDLNFSLASAVDIAKHAILPAGSIVLTGIGGWGLGMRAMMVTIMGEDYMNMAESKGLTPRTIFLGYGLRNAILPQITSLAISLAHIMSGAVIVEVIFAYPGVGYLLFRAISGNDYFLIQGIVLFIILAIGISLLALDLLYPVIDPRIRYGKT
jgi:peptide/nickel transport system permease protein